MAESHANGQMSGDGQSPSAIGKPGPGWTKDELQRRAAGASATVCIRRTTTVSVLFLALIAAVVSFGHMHELALRHGETPVNAMLIPLSVDGMVVASSMSVLLASRTGVSVSWLPWTLLIVGSLASLAANVAVAEPTVVGRVIAAWPSFAFVGAYHLLQGQLRLRLLAGTEQGGPDPRSARESERVPEDRGDGASEEAAFGRRLQREAWQWALAYRAENGQLPGGMEIARRFDRSPRWGRLVKNAGLAGALLPSGRSASEPMADTETPG